MSDSSVAWKDMWAAPEDDPRQGDGAEDERSVVLGYLRNYRLTLVMKTEGLDAEQLARRSVPPSTMSLLGLIRHMADVERHWFRRVMAGEVAPYRFKPPENRDGDFDGAVGDDAVVAEAYAALREEIAYAETYMDGVDDLGTHGRMRDGSPVPLRDVLVHMVEEYARHCGHADLLRECIDGRRGQ